MEKEKYFISVDLEMLEFFSHRPEDGALTLVAEAIIKEDLHLEKISALHRKLLCKEKQ